MSQSTLLDQILGGQNRDLQVLAASGLVPLPPEELLPLQVALTQSPDPEVSGKAAEALRSMEPRFAADFLAERASETELAYFAKNVQHPTVLAAVLRRKDTPRYLMVFVAPILGPELQETLILRQDAILDEPQILLALETNPQLSNYAKRRIWEYREHLLPKEKLPPKSREEIEAEAAAVTKEEMAEAVEEVTGGEAPVDEEGELDLKKLTAEQVRLLPVPMRVKIARGASKEIRNVLVRDKNSQVALAVLVSNPIPDSEVEQIASNRQVCDEVLLEIGKKREWVSKYSIIKALVKNPKTNAAMAVKFVPRMTIRDLRDLARDKNVSDAVRGLALRLHNARRNG
jgi:hypothetical protein